MKINPKITPIGRQQPLALIPFGYYKNQGLDQAFCNIFFQRPSFHIYGTKFNINLYYSHIYIYMLESKHNEMQKERIFIPSLEGAEDDSIGVSCNFSALEA